MNISVQSYLAALRCNAFERAAAGGSDSENASAVFLCIVYELRRSPGQHIVLGVHMVILDIFRLNGSECSETYMKGDESDAHTLFAQGVKELGSEMQSGGRGGGTAALTGIDRLVSVVVFELFGDVVRQRHLSYLIEQLEKHAVICKLCKAVAVRQNVNNLGEEHIMESEPVTLSRFFARTRNNLPDIVALIVEKQKLYNGARVYPRAVETCGKHLGIVENEAVARLYILHDIAEYIVFYRACLFIEHHKSRAVARLGGVLCYELLRQIVKKIAFFHYFPQLSRPETKKIFDL